MKDLIHIAMMIAVMTMLINCGETTREIAKMSQSEKTGVFSEVISQGPPPASYADLVIRASLKIPLAEHYPLESNGSAHEKAAYSFLINIDGQAVLWQVEGKKHVLPEHVDGETSHDPEAGEGMKFVLDKKVRLAAGSYKVFFGLPDAPYYTIVDISVKSGGSYVLEFKPHYWFKNVPMRLPTFTKGINKYDNLFKEIVGQAR